LREFQQKLISPLPRTPHRSVLNSSLHAKDQKVRCQALQADRKGKLLHRSPGTRHIANTKSSKQKRRLGKAKVLSENAYTAAQALSAFRSLISPAHNHNFVWRVNFKPTRRRLTYKGKT
jgi:ribosomal protein L35